MSSNLEERLGTAQEKLSKIQRQMQRSARITAVAGIIILALIAGYFYYGYREISVLLEPDKLVALGEQMIDDNLPKAREYIQEEAIKNAPMMAEQLSSQLITTAPELRKGIEEHSLKQTKKVVDELTTVSEAEFRKILKENPQTIKLAIKELKESDDVSNEVLTAVETALEGEMEYSIKEQSKEILGVLTRMKLRLERLQANTKLNEEEKLEREILMIVRHLQKKHVNVDPAVKQLNEVIDIVGEPKQN